MTDPLADYLGDLPFRPAQPGDEFYRPGTVLPDVSYRPATPEEVAMYEAVESAMLAMSTSQDQGSDRMKKIYLAGPMSGLPDNNFPAFDRAAERLRAAGHEVISPADMTRAAGFDASHVSTPAQYAAFLRDDIKAILTVDAIAMLPGWQDSRGATLEFNVAAMIGLDVIALDREPVTTLDDDDGA